MKVTHLGGAECVTGSCHLLESCGLNIMVDCGAVQGNDRAVPMERWRVPPRDIDYLFLTHAHIDHIGRVPELIERGFTGEIICTHPTRELLFPMLEDAMGLSGKSHRQIEKLYAKLDDFSWGFEYDNTFDLRNGIRFLLGNAGHILGSCFVRLESYSPSWSVIFSGDLGPPHTPILSDPDIPDPCDLLVLESTYGDRIHDDRIARVERLEKILTRALSDNGKVYIPAFALGRCQELIYEMDRVFTEYGWENKIPVFIDSPLGVKVTDIYSRLSGFWDQEASGLLKNGDHPIDFSSLYSIGNHKSHTGLISFSGPAIIIAGSGMCTGGRIVNHLIHGLEDKRNDVLFVGYQVPGTPGKDILRYGKTDGGHVWLGNKQVNIHAEVHHLTGYSAHADQNDLVDWVRSFEKPPGEIRLVHGNARARKALARRLGI